MAHSLSAKKRVRQNDKRRAESFALVRHVLLSAGIPRLGDILFGICNCFEPRGIKRGACKSNRRAASLGISYYRTPDAWSVVFGFLVVENAGKIYPTKPRTHGSRIG